MRKYLIGAVIVFVVALGAFGASALLGDDDTADGDVAAAEAQTTPDIATVTGDDTTNDDALGTQGEDEDVPGEPQPEVEGPITVAPVELNPDAVMGDLHLFVTARAADLSDAVTALNASRGEGADISAALASLVDDVTIFGEAVITGVAITPDTLEVVPDLRERHQTLISDVGAVHDLLSSLDPGGSGEEWDSGIALITETLSGLGASLT